MAKWQLAYSVEELARVQTSAVICRLSVLRASCSEEWDASEAAERA